MKTMKQSKEQAEQEILAFVGEGCILTSLQVVGIASILFLADLDYIVKWFFILPAITYSITMITFVIKMIQLRGK